MKVKASRLLLGLAGAGLIGYGLLGLPTQLGADQLVGLFTWLAAAVLFHDGMLVPLTTLAGFGLRRLTAGLRRSSEAVVRGALLTGVVVTALAATLLRAQSVARTTSVLEADYTANLAWFWLALLLTAGGTVYLLEAGIRGTPSRRQKTLP